MFTQVRLWLGYTVILSVLYFVVGEKPLFCPFTDSPDDELPCANKGASDD